MSLMHDSAGGAMIDKAIQLNVLLPNKPFKKASKVDN